MRCAKRLYNKTAMVTGNWTCETTKWIASYTAAKKAVAAAKTLSPAAVPPPRADNENFVSSKSQR